MKQFFPEIKGTIRYEGKDSKNPLAFRYYDPKRKVAGKTMEQHLRFAIAYWHTMKGGGADIFGQGTYCRPWEQGSSQMERAENTLQAAFEFFTKLGVKYYCFHDRDIAPEGKDFAESCRNLDRIVALAGKFQKDTGVNLLWGTANLFSNPRFMHGAGSNPNAHVFAYGAAQVKHALDATLELGGENYVFWGGREGYESLLNTDYAQEQEQLARFFQLAVDYKKKIGFKGPFLIEPKPKEPTKHQYDFDSATVIGFLERYGLSDHFKLNIEANHATLAGHTFEHELTVASASGKLGSIDANTGDLLLGWDTDQFLTSTRTAAYAMMIVLKQGGFGSGGLNFDAKVRRGSIDTIDLFHAHIGSMDTFAKGLLVADLMLREKAVDSLLAKRYASYKTGIGSEIMKGKTSLEKLEKWILANGEPTPVSGRQEMLENIVSAYIDRV